MQPFCPKTVVKASGHHNLFQHIWQKPGTVLSGFHYLGKTSNPIMDGFCQEISGFKKVGLPLLVQHGTNPLNHQVDHC